MKAALVVLALAGVAAAQAPASNSTFFMCDCPGEEAKDYVCGTDGQTYGNDCLRQCSNMALRGPGICEEEGCYPAGEPNCSGDFESREPMCSMGLTWMSKAEGNCGGTGLSATCSFAGVCTYRDDDQPITLPTTGGKGLDWKKAAANTQLPGKTDPPYDYSEALSKLLLYYDGLISGNLTAPGVCKRRLTWRSDSCIDCTGEYGEDLSGGFFEAGGSTLKFPMVTNGFTGTMLAWAGLEYGAAFDLAGALDDLKWKVKWAADHVIAAHPQPDVICGFVGNMTIDFDNWSPVEYHETFGRPVGYEGPLRYYGYITKDNPGSEMAGDGAATLASAALLLGDDDPAWKAEALRHAVEMYEFGVNNPGSYQDSKDPGIETVANLYGSNNGFWDDLAWAAAWLYKATNETKYLTEAKAHLAKAPPMEQGGSFETGYKTPGAAILIAGIDGDAKSMEIAQKYFDAYLNGVVRHTDAGAAIPYHWGANRHVGNLGFLTMVHAKSPKVAPDYAARLFNYGMHQTNYLLGDAGRSWVVGFGSDWPTLLNHKYSLFSIQNWNPDPLQEPLGERIWMTDVEGNWSPLNRPYVQRAKFEFEGSRNGYSHTPWGAVFGAPLMDDSLINSRRDYSYSESTTECNAAAVGAVAALADWYSTGAYTGVESLEGVIPFTCDPPTIPFAAVASPPAVLRPPAKPPSPLLPIATSTPEAPSSSTEASTSSSSNTGVIVGAVLGGIAAVALCAFLSVYFYRKKQRVAGNPADPERPATRPDESLVLTATSKDSVPSSVNSDDVVMQWISSQPQRTPSSRVATAIPAHVADVEFTWDAVKPIKQLGSGSFGRVYLAEVNHSRVALKVLVDTNSLAAVASQPAKLSSISSARSSVATASASDMIKEVTVLASLRHTNVVQLVGFCMSPPCVAMEYCTRGSLFDVLHRGATDAAAARDLPWGRRVRMAADSASGMLHLHTRSPQVLHRDLKSPNLLVASDWTIKVGDVGLSKLVEEASRTSVTNTAGGAANPRWLAPEVLAGERPTAASDIYSFGVVLWELLTWQLPWSDGAVFAIAHKIQIGERPTVPPANALPGPADGRPSPAALQAYLALMQRCWAQDPAQRPDFQGVAASLAALQ